MADPSISAMSDELINAYRQTHYHVFTNDPITLKVGEINHALIKLYDQYEVKQCAFITAYNPYSSKTTLDDNQDRQRRLKAVIQTLNLDFIEGEGKHPDGQWEGEPSFFVLGIEREWADSMAKTFEQNAYIWTDSYGRAHLRILR